MRKKWAVLGAVGLLIIISIVLVLIPRHKAPENSSTERLQALSEQVSLPLYHAQKQSYSLTDARAEDGSIVLATYTSDKGIINVTYQPRPAIDPFEKVKPADSFSTSIGDARLYPDDKNAPYIVIDTPLTWIIVRSTSLDLKSSDLKEFCLSLKQV